MPQSEDVHAEMRKSGPALSPRTRTGPKSCGRGMEPPQDSGSDREDVDDDVGIRGLTIVLHLKDKDDLVISTDLTHGTRSL